MSEADPTPTDPTPTDPTPTDPTPATIAETVEEASDVTRPEHPVRKLVQPIYTVKSLPRAMRRYFIEAHAGDLPALRIVRAANSAFIASDMATITLFDLYAIWLQLYSMKTVVNARAASLQHELTIKQFAVLFREWIRGGTRSQCFGLVRSVSETRGNKIFSDKIFASLSLRKRELTPVDIKSAIKSAKMTPDTRLPRSLTSGDGKNVPNLRIGDLITTIFSYAVVTKINNIQSMVIPLETEVLDGIKRMADGGIKLHGLIAAIRLLYGEGRSQGDSRSNTSTRTIEAPRPSGPQVAPTLPATPAATPTAPAAHAAPTEPLFDEADSPDAGDDYKYAGDDYKYAGDDDFSDIDTEVDIAGIIKAASAFGVSTADVQSAFATAEDAGDEASTDKSVSDIDAEAGKAVARGDEINRNGRVTYDDVILDSIPAPTEPESEPTRKLSAKERSAKKAEEDKKRHVEAIKAEQSVSMSERLGASDIMDDL